jgi:hypothetical protein
MMFTKTFNSDGTISGIGKLEDSGSYTWFSIESQTYLAWCAEGNEPLPADEGAA